MVSSKNVDPVVIGSGPGKFWQGVTRSPDAGQLIGTNLSEEF